ncbi:MAG TPA: hypothetical protein GX015_07085 [Corynebacterium sp.]|uniref:hypothetical protein n=1 Tax=Corynebacterium sp. TaxID=1720 RepID=UPI00185C4FEF|nr:hypothetical protein [Corynebacterium sp.]HHT32295.1 hypothetical protein [Corynebacterium sp.]
MSISMHIDEYMARRGITPDDTVVVDDPCAVFDGAVEKAEGLEGEISRVAGLSGAAGESGAGDAGLAVTAEEADRDRRGDAEEKLARAAETVRDLLG